MNSFGPRSAAAEGRRVPPRRHYAVRSCVRVAIDASLHLRVPQHVVRITAASCLKALLQPVQPLRPRCRTGRTALRGEPGCGRWLDCHCRTRTDARQRGQADVGSMAMRPVPGRVRRSNPGLKRNDPGRKLSINKQIGACSGCEEIPAHCAEHIVATDDALREDIAQDHERRETGQ